MSDAILTLNAGSSSLKFALFDIAGDDVRAAITGEIEKLDSAPHLVARDAQGRVFAEKDWDHAPAFDALVDEILTWAEAHLNGNALVAVGHRMVHGGPDHTAPARVTPALLKALDDLVPLAPLHLPHNIAPIRAVAKARPDLVQVVTFDTAFHRTMPRLATLIAVPRKYQQEGVRRYGFHGLSYEYIAGRLSEIAPALAKGRTIVAHLGNGASLCALKGGQSVDTTMGFSALDGLVMGTRPGDIDPGVLLYLEERHGMDVHSLEHMLYNDCGMKGVSGISGDMRTLTESKDPAAKEAVDLFVFRLAREIGALTASLGGLDGLVFTGGIGEHAADIRAMTAARLDFMGAKLDAAANARHDLLISAPDSKIALYVIPTDEEQMIARHTRQCLD